jgi:hypothetical protein
MDQVQLEGDGFFLRNHSLGCSASCRGLRRPLHRYYRLGLALFGIQRSPKAKGKVPNLPTVPFNVTRDHLTLPLILGPSGLCRSCFAHSPRRRTQRSVPEMDATLA